MKNKTNYEIITDGLIALVRNESNENEKLWSELNSEKSLSCLLIEIIRKSVSSNAEVISLIQKFNRNDITESVIKEIESYLNDSFD